MKYIILLAIMLSACGRETYFDVPGPQGPKGDAGAKGDTGEQGLIGLTGTNGTNGVDGNEITMIKFCPDDSPNYPSTFPEYGIVVGSNIYAVYSTHGGFLALLPPGTYNSNAVGSSCTFTINLDGSITNE